ncbi:T9SS type A sorting domain-containing protein [bacterium]|nr:T9SS type A sorting domain-containing protein [bacterium]
MKAPLHLLTSLLLSLWVFPVGAQQWELFKLNRKEFYYEKGDEQENVWPFMVTSKIEHPIRTQLVCRADETYKDAYMQSIGFAWSRFFPSANKLAWNISTNGSTYFLQNRSTNQRVKTRLMAGDSSEYLFQSGEFSGAFQLFHSAYDSVIFGTRDSVRRFKIYFENNHKVHFLILSKNHGIMKLPYKAGGVLVRTHPQIPTFSRFFDLEIGDIIEYRDSFFDYPNQTWENDVKLVSTTYSDKYWQNDTLFFQIDETIESVAEDKAITQQRRKRTLWYSKTFLESPVVDDSFSFDIIRDYYFSHQYGRLCFTKGRLQIHYEMDTLSDSLFRMGFSDSEYLDSKTYLEGLGEEMHKLSGNGNAYFGRNYEIVFFKKGNEEWGKKRVGVEPLGTNEPISIYPNPGKFWFYIYLHKPANCIVYNEAGQMIDAFAAKAGMNHFGDYYKSGRYLLVIQSGASRYSRWLVKE